MKQAKIVDLSVLVIRLAFGFRLIYGTVDNIVSWERMLEFRDFLELHGFPFPLVCALVSVFFQFLSGISWMIGYKVRWSSAIMMFNFLVAILAIHIGDAYLDAAPAIHLLVISFFLFASGEGKYALDSRRRRINENE